MATIVREADLDADAATIQECLRRFLTPHADLPRYQWLYRDNPQGQVRAWLAIDVSTQSVIGSAAAFPRRLYENGQAVSAWVLGDFCIDDRYRVLGPALTLQRAMLAALESSGARYCYDFPGEKMVAIYKRMGIAPAARMVRMARLLRLDRKVAEHVRLPWVAGAVSAIGNCLLPALARRPRIGSTDYQVMTGGCGEEFTRLHERIADRHGACVERSAAYLNWRFIDNPYRDLKIMAARQGGDLVAYAVFGRSGDEGTIADLFGVADDDVLAGLLHQVVSQLRADGVFTVNCELIESHPWLGVVEAMGFRRRETKPWIAFPLPRGSSDELSVVREWFVMHGDRDS